MVLLIKSIRFLAANVFVLSVLTCVVYGIPYFLFQDPRIPLVIQVAVLAALGGGIIALASVILEQQIRKPKSEPLPSRGTGGEVMVVNSSQIPGREIVETLGLVKGHIIWAIWIGKDVAALLRLVAGGELYEYSEMMGKARDQALQRMIEEAQKLGADAVINVFFTTSVVISSAAEFLAYGTAVKTKAITSTQP